MAYTIDLQKAVDSILAQYGDEVVETASETLEEVAKEATQKLKQTSPKQTGKYARGWTYEVKKGRIDISATVYGKKNTYPLAHLLEHGHAKRGGGRTAPITHIKPVEEWAISELENRITQRLETMT